MKKILFCGSERAGNFIVDMCEYLDCSLDFTGEFQYVEQTTNPVLKDHHDYIIYDVSMFLNEPVAIVAELSKIIKICANSKIIIFASGFSSMSQLCKALIEAGFKNFIFGTSLGQKKDELEKCINGYYDVIEHDSIKNAQIIDNEEKKQIEKVFRTIGVVGTQSRIGTTTHAFQIIKYLTLLGYSACYIEMNDTQYINNCVDLYSEAIQKKDCVTFQGIDMYSSDNISEILKLGYDYYVYDYGHIFSKNFQNISFSEKETRIVVAGAKANEISSTQQLLQTQYFKDAHFIFSFIPEQDRDDISDMMGDLAQNVVYADWIPDPFSYSSDNQIYSHVIDAEDKKPKKKFSFFRGK